MLELPGIESDTTSPTNSLPKYPFTRFSHCLRLKDLFSFYDTKRVRVKKIKGNAIRRVLGNGTNSTRIRISHQVFIKAMEMIISGVVNREFIFKLPFKNIDVTLKIIKATPNQTKGLFKYYRGVVDPFDMGFEMVRPVLQIRFPKRPGIILPLSLSKNMYKTMMQNVSERKTYQNSKIKDIEYITDRLELRYPTLLRGSIRSIIRHGLNTIFRGIIRRCDSYINLDSGDDAFFVYFSGSRNISQFANVRCKVRFLLNNTRGKPPHDGTYYFYLSNRKKIEFEEGATLDVRCTTYIQELHIGKDIAPYIYMIKFPEDKRKTFFLTIDKDTEGILYYEQYIENEYKRI